jgi:RNA polymerase sigma-70 factor (ECF subfamily)
LKNEQEAGVAIEKYADTVRRICFVHLKNYHDVEDVFQDVFLKYVLREEPFDDETHEKAWIIRVTVNACKDNLKSFFKRKVTTMDELATEPSYMEDDTKDTLEAVFRLPQKYRDVIYLFYFEGYSAVEIGKILNKKENTIYTWLSRGRDQLKVMLGGEPCGK